MSIWEEHSVAKIYALEANGVVFYVGETHKPLSWRLRGHIAASRRPKFPVALFIAALDVPVSIIGLEENKWCRKRWGSGHCGREAYWISHFESCGVELQNVQFSKKDMRILANRHRLAHSEMPGTSPDMVA